MTMDDSSIPSPFLTVVEGAEGADENVYPLELSSERTEMP
jgi:hypothetical protein